LADCIVGTTQVFPGGNYDEKQDDSYQMTAIRETFEETALLLASSASQAPSHAALDASRKSIHAGRTLFRDFLEEHALFVDAKALLPFTEWITPVGTPRCAHFYFYFICVLSCT
jgi:8-oxo-dGTP pyrophosphatase MutT (NUDIX family)